MIAGGERIELSWIAPPGDVAQGYEIRRAAAAAGPFVPVWFRLQRVGDVITALHSIDGATWFEVGRESLPMPGAVLLGLAACSRNPAETYTALFDHLTLVR